jgi:hypothetical protein
MPLVTVGIATSRVRDHANKVDMLSGADSIALRVKEDNDAEI